MLRRVIFDCDGVLVDSELITSRIFMCMLQTPRPQWPAASLLAHTVAVALPGEISPDAMSEATHEPSRRSVVTRIGLGLVAFCTEVTGSWAAPMASDAASEQRQAAGAVSGPPSAAAAGTITIGDLRVNRLGFGAMRITGEGIWGQPADPQEARAVLRRAVELGVNLIDTADSYGPEISEQLIYEALHPYPQGLIIATKGGLTRPGPNHWVADCSPEHLRTACEGSLRRLHLERIDLYQLHTVDPRVPLEESLGALLRLREQGKIRHIGVSNVTLAQLQQAQSISGVVSVQNRYNLADHANEAVLQYCAKQRLAYLPWAPLAGRQSRRLSLWSSAAEKIAQAHSVSSARVALAWLLAHSPVIVPIPGTSSRQHLEDNVAAAALHLSPAEMQELAPA